MKVDIPYEYNTMLVNVDCILIETSVKIDDGACRIATDVKVDTGYK